MLSEFILAHSRKKKDSHFSLIHVPSFLQHAITLYWEWLLVSLVDSCTHNANAMNPPTLAELFPLLHLLSWKMAKRGNRHKGASPHHWFHPEGLCGDIEALNRLIWAHEMLIRDLKLKDNITNFLSLMATKIATNNRIPMQFKKEHLEDQITECKKFIATMHKEGLLYFEKLLAVSLKPKWQTIVKEVCDSPAHIYNGKKVDMPSRQTLEALPLCYKHVMLLLFTNNSAKHNKCYMSTTTKIPWPELSIQQGIARLKKLNDMSSYHPSLKRRIPRIPSTSHCWSTYHTLSGFHTPVVTPGTNHDYQR